MSYANGASAPATTPDISVSIVSYNTRDLLRVCLLSLRECQRVSGVKLEIIVADNVSRDGSVEMVRAEFPEVIVVETGGNIGYGRANNAALEQATGRYFLILNSDTEVEPDALRVCCDFFEAHPEAGILACKLILPGGSTQLSCAMEPGLMHMFWEQTYLDKLLPPNPFTGGYTLTNWDYNDVREIEQAAGAFLLIRREAYQKVGGFDPAYFMYFEDTDLCIRLRRAGWKMFFVPQARVHHHVGGSSGGNWRTRARMIAYYNQSRYYYFTRYQGALRGKTLKAIVLLGAVLRAVSWSFLALAKPAAREKVRLFRAVTRLTWGMKTDCLQGPDARSEEVRSEEARSEAKTQRRRGENS